MEETCDMEQEDAERMTPQMQTRRRVHSTEIRKLQPGDNSTFTRAQPEEQGHLGSSSGSATSLSLGISPASLCLSSQAQNGQNELLHRVVLQIQ